MTSTFRCQGLATELQILVHWFTNCGCGEFWQAAAIHSAIDVFGENERAILEFDSPAFGDVMMCIIGASQVGSCNVTAKEGQHIKKVNLGVRDPFPELESFSHQTCNSLLGVVWRHVCFAWEVEFERMLMWGSGSKKCCMAWSLGSGGVRWMGAEKFSDDWWLIASPLVSVLVA